MRRFIRPLAATVVLAVLACGGTSNTLIDPSDAAVDPSSPTGGEAGSGDGGAVGTGDGSNAADALATTNADGGAPGGSTTKLPCGTASCNIPAESCCVTRAAGGAFSYACVTGACAGGAGGESTALKCSSTANCDPGLICCVSQNNNLTVSSCKASCSGNEAQLCDPKAMPTGCAAGVPCSSNNIRDWFLPPPFATCGGKGT